MYSENGDDVDDENDEFNCTYMFYHIPLHSEPSAALMHRHKHTYTQWSREKSEKEKKTKQKQQ